jgi:type II restriction enzyme
MARKEDLRKQRAGTVINLTSKKQETVLGDALEDTVTGLLQEFQVELHHQPDWLLRDIVETLRAEFPDVPFADPQERSHMRPDGGILFLVDHEGGRHPILIVEVKNQGTNVLRAAEGKARQAIGNAIERLGKNVIGFRTAMLREGIMPFVCFGYGCDFDETGPNVLDRVITIAMFGPLNEVSVVNLGDGGLFNRGSFFFREDEWTRDEMAEVMLEVARRSIHYYFAKFGPERFAPTG